MGHTCITTSGTCWDLSLAIGNTCLTVGHQFFFSGNAEFIPLHGGWNSDTTVDREAATMGPGNVTSTWVKETTFFLGQGGSFWLGRTFPLAKEIYYGSRTPSTPQIHQSNPTCLHPIYRISVSCYQYFPFNIRQLYSLGVQLALKFNQSQLIFSNFSISRK